MLLCLLRVVVCVVLFVSLVARVVLWFALFDVDCLFGVFECVCCCFVLSLFCLVLLLCLMCCLFFSV